MKRIILTLSVILFSQITNAQTNLENNYKIELGLQGISVGTEIPLSDKFLADINLGWGGITDLCHYCISY